MADLDLLRYGVVSLTFFLFTLGSSALSLSIALDTLSYTIAFSQFLTLLESRLGPLAGMFALCRCITRLLTSKL